MSEYKMKLLILCLISMTLIITCQSDDYTDKMELPSALNLVGEFEGPAFGGILNETWRRDASGAVIQVGYYIEDGDTLTSQIVKFELFNNKVFLIALVDEKPPLIFEGVLVTDEKVIFENMNYTNPYRIEYIISENEYRRVTTGTEDGEESINRYHLIRK